MELLTVSGPGCLLWVPTLEPAFLELLTNCMGLAALGACSGTGISGSASYIWAWRPTLGAFLELLTNSLSLGACYGTGISGIACYIWAWGPTLGLTEAHPGIISWDNLGQGLDD
jgi:hypothetical protein